jgi:hypothetical protein
MAFSSWLESTLIKLEGAIKSQTRQKKASRHRRESTFDKGSKGFDRKWDPGAAVCTNYGLNQCRVHFAPKKRREKLFSPQSFCKTPGDKSRQVFANLWKSGAE